MGNVGLAAETDFAAFIDVLGFRNLVLKSPELEDFAQLYRSIFQDALRSDLDRFGVEYRLFSDSLFLRVSRRRTDERLGNLLRFAQRLLVRSCIGGLPLRGAVAYGSLIWNEDIVVGTPIIEAVEYEGLQNWIGMILGPTCARYLAENRGLEDRLREADVIRLHDVPIRPAGGRRQKLQAWAVTLRTESSEEHGRLEAALRAQKIQAGEEGAQRKYDETMEFLEHCRLSE